MAFVQTPLYMCVALWPRLGLAIKQLMNRWRVIIPLMWLPLCSWMTSEAQAAENRANLL